MNEALEHQCRQASFQGRPSGPLHSQSNLSNPCLADGIHGITNMCDTTMFGGRLKFVSE